MKNVRAYNAMPAKTYKRHSKVAQRIVERDRDTYKQAFNKMLEGKDPLFLKRATHMIVQWQRNSFDPSIVHIHGDADNTLPIKHIQADYVIPNGSHMMTLTRAKAVFEIIELEIAKAE
jgi:hypothetical protein